MRFVWLIFAVYSVGVYAWFRSGIYNYLRVNKVSKTYIRKHRKGLCNYWLYCDIHREHSLGVLYPLNIVFLILLMAFWMVGVLFGWLEAMKIPTVVASICLCLIELPAIILTQRYDCLAEYGRPFVWFRRRNESKQYDSSVLDWASYAIPVALVWWGIRGAFGI